MSTKFNKRILNQRWMPLITVAHDLHISKHTLADLIRARRIGSKIVDGEPRLSRTDIEKYLRPGRKNAWV